MIYRFDPAAQQELRAAAEWYFDEGGRLLADDFQAAVYRAIQLIANMPKLGTRAYPDTRIWPLKRFPYSLVYRLEIEGVCVLAVAHQRREPGYWKGRVR